jgi:hypothetical protein
VFLPEKALKTNDPVRCFNSLHWALKQSNGLAIGVIYPAALTVNEEQLKQFY